jgi:hypothetical protein
VKLTKSMVSEPHRPQPNEVDAQLSAVPQRFQRRSVVLRRPKALDLFNDDVPHVPAFLNGVIYREGLGIGAFTCHSVGGGGCRVGGWALCGVPAG